MSGADHQGASWPPLTPDQQTIVEQNTGLVHWCVNRNRSIRPHERDDRVQDGMLGLIRAAQLYDPTLGFTFSTYAHRWIRQAIARGRSIEQGIDWRRAWENGDPRPEPPTSLNAPIFNEGLATLADVIANQADDYDRLGHARPDDRLSALRKYAMERARDDIDRAAIDDLFGPTKPNATAIARRTGCSRQTVLNRQRRIMRILTDYADRIAA